MNEPEKKDLLKVKPPPEYPPEDGRYLRGNDFSPAAVVVLLHTYYDRIPEMLEKLAKVAVESGAALAGMLQTENIGIEKIVCNIVANPNIRYVILCGIESAGHTPGHAFRCFVESGVDNRRNIIGCKSPTPYLYNIPPEAIDRFRKQVQLIDLVRDDERRLRIDPEILKQAIWACYQEKPTEFLNYVLFDPGAYPEPPICTGITWRIEQPWAVHSEEEDQKMKQILEAASRANRRESQERQSEENPSIIDLLFPRRTRDEKSNQDE